MKYSLSALILGLAAALPLFPQPGANPVIQVGTPRVSSPGAAQPVAPSTVLATVDTQKITAARLRELLQGAPEPALRSAQRDPADFLAWTAVTEKFSNEAVKQGLDKKAPYADRLDWARRQLLTMARIQAEQRKGPMTEEQAKAWYLDHAHEHARAGIRLIYIAKLPGKEAQAHAKLAEVQKQLKAGVEFAKVARQLSDHEDSAEKDGDFGTIEKDSKIPLEIRKAVLKLDANQVSSVFEQPAGYYVFQVTSKEMRPFEEAKAEIMQKAQQQGLEQWMQTQRDASSVKILNEAFFQGLRTASLAGAAMGSPPVGPDVKPDMLLAEINGKPVTGERFSALLKGMPPQTRSNAIMRPDEFLKQWAFMQRLSDSAVEMGLDQQQPYKGQLWFSRGQILVQALVDEYLNTTVVTTEEQKAGYDKDPERFRIATVAAIRIPYSLSPPPQTDPKAPKVMNEDEARVRAEAALAEVVGGLSFEQAVVKYAEDEELRGNGGLLPPLAARDPGVPENIRKLVFGAKAGDVLGPVKMPNGFYLFKVVNLALKPYTEVKDQVYEELRQARFQAWFDGARKGFQIKIDNPEAFRAVAAETPAH